MAFNPRHQRACVQLCIVDFWRPGDGDKEKGL
jgi:hypothetical protein